MNVVLVDVVGLVGIVATVETGKADTEDVRWEMQKKVVLLANSPPRSAAVLAGAVVLLPLESSLWPFYSVSHVELLEQPDSSVNGWERKIAEVSSTAEGR